MSNDVSFANEAIWDKNRAAVILTAEQADRQILCLISYETLRDRFGAEYSDPMPNFEANRIAIERAAKESRQNNLTNFL